MKIKTILMIGLAMVLSAIAWIANPAMAAPTTSGAEIFSVHCVGCHANGGNIIRRNKTLKAKALKKYNMDSLAAIVTLVEQGKSVMPAFQDRLSDREITAVAAYILEQAENNWK